MQQFRPPIDNAAFMALCKWGLFLELFRARLSVRVVGDGIERFSQLRGKKAVVICNHPDQDDPEVVFTFSKIVGEDFYFIAAREVFDWFLGTCGMFFQNLGVYSVVRGGADQESYQTTREIIAHGARKLVVFPEGEVTWQPDVLLPFKRGATKLFFESQEMLINEQRWAEPILVQPIATRWRYKGDISNRLHAAVRRIEQRLEIPPASASLVERVYGAAGAMLTVLENEYRAQKNESLPFEERVQQLRDHVLRRMAQMLNIELPEGEIHRDWLRRVGSAIDDFVSDKAASKCSFQQKLHHDQAAKMRAMVKDVHRIQHLVGVNPERFRRPPTQERLASIVAKIELEVLGRISKKGPREVLVGVGTPLSMLDFYDLYQQDQHAAVEQATQAMQLSLQSLIDELDQAIPQMDYVSFLPR